MWETAVFKAPKKPALNLASLSGQLCYNFREQLGGRAQGGRLWMSDHIMDNREVTFPVSNLPPDNPHFIGRNDHLQRLENTITGATTITQTIAGLGGVGKSQLALHFAHRRRDLYDIVWLLRVDEALAADFLALGQAQGLAVIGQKHDAAEAADRNWLNGTDKRWLMLFDNADETEPKQLRDLLTTSRKGRVLMKSGVSAPTTSRPRLGVQRRSNPRSAEGRDSRGSGLPGSEN
jgi:hypothetical protein